ncbi:hypothetical protein GGX14DRAFT_602769 [Mycena pura]|uniref:Uncharacterized protein n=1 Tax=Mycena pura TaxID=153505 RepID=A0AAD6YHC0_9AGAR|nr:hypothetical protein GGX14DRAFT_602769 [Mycena pura]
MAPGDCAPPVPNTDVSGIGVRVSFYLQYTLAALSCTVSQEIRDIEDALSTLAVTNMAYCVTTLVLGFKSSPELTLYDGLVVMYLTLFILGFCFAITVQYTHAHGFNRYLYLLACTQCYLVLGTFLAICITMPSFGSDAACNSERRVSILFAPVSTHAFRIAGIPISSVLLIFETVLISFAYNNFLRSFFFGKGESKKHSEYIPKLRKVQFASNTIVYGLCVAHVETLRLYNKPDPSDSYWGFGQILPVFLIAHPAMRTLSLLRQHVAPRMCP